MKDVIIGLDEILKHLFLILINRYYKKYPEDSKNNNMQKAGIIINELVIEELKADQIDFRRHNSELIDTEKKDVMLIEEVKNGVLCFLIAKGCLYRSFNHPSADKWINEAFNINQEVILPNTLEEIQSLIYHYLEDK